MLNASDSASATLRDLADPAFLDLVDRAVAAGSRWTFDPEHDDVVGLSRPGSELALVIVYTAEDDFEADEDALAEAAGS